MAAPAESEDKQVEALLAEGLDHYGMGQVERAVACWQRVLEIDPVHAEARDFLRTAGFLAEEPAPEPGAGDGDLLAEPQALIREGRIEEALVRLEALARRHPGHLDVQGHLELARGWMAPRYGTRIGNGRAVPRLLPEGAALASGLSASTRFVLAMIDGSSSVTDICELSGMDRFDVVRALCALLDAGAVELLP
jgi:tetratricopeptide (TPR) repeat protein